MLTSTPEGRTRYLHADMHDRDALIEGAMEILDLSQPVAVLFISVLGHVTDTGEAHALVRGVMDRMPSGSYLTLADAAHATDDDGRLRRAQDEYADTGAVPYRTRTPEELAGFFAGLERVDPGLVSVPLWRPDPAQVGEPRRDDTNLGGIARKP